MHTPKSINIHCNISKISVFTVPPDLLECKDCPVKVEVLDVTKQHKNIAEKALEKFNSEGNTQTTSMWTKLKRFSRW